jgi:PPOX class probable F420-dependent enzyme
MSRRDQIKMSDEEIKNFLKSARTMILVSNGKDGYPHPMPMWFWVDDDGTVFMTTFRKSQKVRNLKRDPRVSLLVESGDAYQELRSVLIYAEAEVIDDLEYTKQTMFNISAGRGDVNSDQPDVVMGALERSAGKRVVLRFKPSKIVSWNHAKLGGVY